jgi:N-acetylglucosaminyldiphosphoundecaprenol N-acetyl-beta-D-mannosaminyltransferase
MTKAASLPAGIGNGDPPTGNAGVPLAAYSFLGIRVNPLTVPKLNALVSASIAGNRQIVIACHNLHSVYVFHHDAKMRLLQKRVEYLHIDGMGIVLLGRLLGYPLRRQHRVTYLDWIEPLLKQAVSQKWRVYYVGLRGSICAGIQEAFRRDFPDLQFKAAHWDIDNKPVSELEATIPEDINAFQPHILFIGMGMPRQEHWILDHADKISANVMLPCGAAMDYKAGAVKAPPRWVGRWGMEWLFRLLSEPRHLWRRYLIEPWYVLRLFCLELIAAHSKSR